MAKGAVLSLFVTTGKRKKAQMKQQKRDNAMDTEDGGWLSGVPAAEEDAAGPSFIAMDTSDFGAVKSKAFKAQRVGMKIAAMRGTRSTKQKRRKAAKLEKALAVAGRLETKAAAVEPRKQQKKAAKALWADD
eukprot:scaffold1.g5600.t1